MAKLWYNCVVEYCADIKIVVDQDYWHGNTKFKIKLQKYVNYS